MTFKSILLFLALLQAAFSVQAQTPLALTVKSAHRSPYDDQHLHTVLELKNTSEDTIFFTRRSIFRLAHQSAFITQDFTDDLMNSVIHVSGLKDSFKSLPNVMLCYMPDIIFTDSAYKIEEYDSLFLSKNAGLKFYTEGNAEYIMLLPNHTLVFNRVALLFFPNMSAYKLLPKDELAASTVSVVLDMDYRINHDTYRNNELIISGPSPELKKTISFQD